MFNVSMHSTQRVPESSWASPLRVVAMIVLMALTMGSLGLVYCYLTSPTPSLSRDASIFPRLPMHPF